MGTAVRFWNWTAERYSRQNIADEASYRRKLELTQKHLAPDMHVVEFGCGTGSTAILHAPHVGTYHAVDVSQEMVSIARKKAEQANVSNMQFTVGTLEEAGELEGSCDVVLGLNILHLVPDLRGTLGTVARILKPGGIFASSSICLAELRGRLRLLARGASALPFLPTVGHFSESELEELHQEAGLSVEERFSQAPGVVFWLAKKRSLASWKG